MKTFPAWVLSAWIFIAMPILNLHGQDKDSLSQKPESRARIKGYVSNLFSPRYSTLQKNWEVADFVNQRLNFSWSPSSRFSFTAEMRNRMIINQQAQDTSYFNLQEGAVYSNDKFFMNAVFDRFNLRYTSGKVEVTLGRQRINWGQSFVWNPNDLFNSYSFFDFDYIERPGADAIRIQYFNSFTSSAELAARVDARNRITAAALYRFNRNNFDLQFLGGILSGDELAAGAGFTGNIGSTSIFGESSWFRPMKKDTTAMIMVDLGCSRNLPNNVGLQLEALYVSRKMDPDNLFQMLQSPADVRKIAFAPLSLLGSLSYPLTPLINSSMALIWFPGKDGIHGLYAGPSAEISLGNNLSMSLIVQYFNGHFPDPKTGGMQQQALLLSFARLKWNF